MDHDLDRTVFRRETSGDRSVLGGGHPDCTRTGLREGSKLVCHGEMVNSACGTDVEMWMQSLHSFGTIECVSRGGRSLEGEIDVNRRAANLAYSQRTPEGLI